MEIIKKSKKYINNEDEIENQEDENAPINKINNSNMSTNKNKIGKCNCIYTLSILLFLIVLTFIAMYIKIYYDESQTITNINYKRQTNQKLLDDFNKTNTSNKINDTEINPPDKIINIKETIKNENISKSIIQEILNFTNNTSSNNGKIGVAFVFKSLFGNGIGRALSNLCSELAKLEIYDIYMITGGAVPAYDFDFDKKVNMVRIAGNKTLIEEYDKTSNIKIYVLHNDLNPGSIKWYRNLNGGKKVIGMMHGVYMSSIFANLTGVYSIWKYNNLYDAYIQVNADDYYVNKRLGINNSYIHMIQILQKIQI